MCDNQAKEKLLELFGTNVKFLREEGNMSYRKLAQQCNIDYSDLSKIEKGLIRIQLPTVFDLASGLGVHPMKLFDFEIPESS